MSATDSGITIPRTQRMDMQPIEPNRVMHFQLTAEQCEIVLRHLNTGQHGVVRPIIDSLMQQLQQQTAPRFAPP